MRVALLTPLEAADILRVSVDTIRRCIHNGTFKAVKIGQQYRIKQTDIDKLFGEPTKRHQNIAEQVEREIVQSALNGMRYR